MDEVVRNRVVCVYFKNPGLLDSFAEACFRFTSQIAIRKDEAVFLEIGRSQRLFREETLFLRLDALARRFRGNAVIRSGRDAASAFAKARYDVTDPLLLPLSALSAYADPFAHLEDDQAALLEKMIGALRRLGLRTIEDFLMFPAAAVTSRFGEQGLTVYQKIKGILPESPWPLLKPVEKITESVDIESETGFQTVNELEPLFFFVKILTDRIMARLRGRGERAGTVLLRLHMQRGINTSGEETSREWRIPFTVPQGSSMGIARLLREKLEHDLNRNPLPTSTSAMEVVVEETVPGLEAQKNFFHNKEEEHEEWGALYSRLVEKLGENRVFMAEPVERHRPEKAWRPVRHASGKIAPYTHLPQRPTRILSAPQRLYRDGRFLTGSENKNMWMALNWEGPERIDGDWWYDKEGAGFVRDYFRVTTQTGEQLWIYREPETKTGNIVFYLHGYFD